MTRIATLIELILFPYLKVDCSTDSVVSVTSVLIFSNSDSAFKLFPISMMYIVDVLKMILLPWVLSSEVIKAKVNLVS